jgi:hypothetical protein
LVCFVHWFYDSPYSDKVVGCLCAVFVRHFIWLTEGYWSCMSASCVTVCLSDILHELPSDPSRFPRSAGACRLSEMSQTLLITDLSSWSPQVVGAVCQRRDSGSVALENSVSKRT